ncbi:MAG: hypothetical protein Q7R45_04830 [Sulfuricaulis sp.]|nr:hypothetical protein [Sulfuricaulis sp.]
MQNATLENIVEKVEEKLGKQTVINISDKGLRAAGNGMRLAEIRAALPELEAACNRAIEAAEDFGTLCQLVGLKAGTDPAVVKAFVSARCKETVAKAEAKAEQLSLLFSEIV